MNVLKSSFLGKLIGRYYTREGKLTPYGKVVKSLIRQAEKSHNDDELVKRKFPPCNVEWDVSKGTRVWCTRKRYGSISILKKLVLKGLPKTTVTSSNHVFVITLKS